MNNSKIENIIEDVLSLRRMSRSSPASSFVVNEASKDLRQVGDEALPDIEHAIRTLDVPESVDHNGLHRKYPGLLNLWVAYFSISGKTQIERATAFLRSLDGPVFTTAIQGIGVTWPNGRRSNGGIPAPLLEFLAEMAKQTTNDGSNAAKRLLARGGAK